MRYGSVCSGIEAASVAWHPLGWRPAFFSEIEAFPRAVLQHRFPDVPLHGDFTTIKGDEYGPIDLLVGGTPCQSFSIAGLRGGLDDDRGNLALEFLRLADRTRPRWVVWENVPGVLSSNGGRDFGSILGGLGELGYGWAYRVLDAQYFGVAQRRRRVFVVGHLGDWRRAAAVLFERHSLSGHPAPRREAGERIAACLGAGAASSGQSPNVGNGQGTIVECAGTLNARGPYSLGIPEVDGGQIIPWPAEVAPTLNAAFGSKQGLENQHIHSGAGLFVPIAFDATQITSPGNFSNPKSGDACHPLAAGAHAPAVAFDWQSGGDARGLDPKPTAQLQRGQVPAVAFSDVSDCLFAAMGTKWNGNAAAFNGSQYAQAASAVRRLTPRECERLQGFPDDWTLIPYRGKPADQCPDGPRYKALGNSMAVPVMRWIGERIQAVDAIANVEAAA